jgi:hypothetical protein
MRIVLKNVSLFFPTICVFPADRILLYVFCSHLLLQNIVFHLQHCATQCAAPKLWKQLK